jgi:hypothetical protein
MTAAPRDLARDAEASRARLDLTIDRLERRLSPVGLVDEAVGLVRRSASLPAVDRGLAAAKDNPLPVLLIAAGAGLFAWRLWNDRAGHDGQRGPDVSRTGNGAAARASRSRVEAATVERAASASSRTTPHTSYEGESK